MWQLHPFFKSPGSGYQASDFICGKSQPAGNPLASRGSSLKRNYSLRSPFGQHGTRALLRVATFLQRCCSRVLFTVCVVFALGIRR